MIASLVFGLIALLGTVLTSAQALLVWRFRKGAPPFAGGPPASRRADSFISILKPVCGLDDELEENLLSFTRLEGLRYEVVVSAAEWDDPAVEVVRRVMRAHPSAPFRLVVGGGTFSGVVNRKVERLIEAAGEASGDILFISDSNVRVKPGDLAASVEGFADERVGCVSTLFTAAGAETPGALVESLHLLAFVVPGAVSAAALGVPCVVGKSMAISRRAYEAIGGFERFRRILAEDQAIGLAVRDAGFQVVLSPVVVRNVIVNRTLGQAVSRQVRWNKIRFSFSRPLYAAEVVLNPLPFALAAALGAPEMLAPLPLAVLAARMLTLAIVDRATGASTGWRQVVASPLLDVVMLLAWLVPFVSNEVTWRGHRARLGRNTEMIQTAA